ncbi:MAG: threonine--tRNA ligase [Candidatus Nomurabacteria bacterium]|nr:threonine--tRNA ligase [Candidatus Nomurabacteria bacterium]
MENTEKLQNIRHTLAHLLAQAVKKNYPNVQLTLGPAVDNGFYYDIDFGTDKLSDEDLSKIQATMLENIPSWTTFTHEEVSKEKALEIFAGNVYKAELINEIADRGEVITLYTCGGFTDLCRGGHAENPAAEIPADSFKLDRVAGAYWRGSELNKMLTRIYGLAFENKEELEKYIWQLEEAKKRDHRKIGKEMGLFVFSELVGPGLPLWTPKGTIIRELLNDYVWELRKKHGYQKVTIPHITKKELYETSGHWAKYADDLFKINTRENHTFAMKPMNCPHHTQIFDCEPRSYRDMPQRYCETTMVYRDEQSGELSGLSRVLSITQDDAHVFCRENQIEAEAIVIWDIIETFYKTFGFDLKVRFSKHDPATPEKYLGSPETWAKAEGALQSLMEKKGVEWIDGTGEAAFYGPKIDFISHDSIGRVLQVATIQLDFNQPKNFGLTFTNEKGEKEQVVMIHCAIMGSIERFMSTLIEHLAGVFPIWLSPTQISVIPVKENHEEDTIKIIEALNNESIRTNHVTNGDSLGKRIHAGKKGNTPYVIVYGDKEKESGMLTIETRTGEKIQITIEALIEKINTEIKNRS